MHHLNKIFAAKTGLILGTMALGPGVGSIIGAVIGFLSVNPDDDPPTPEPFLETDNKPPPKPPSILFPAV